MENARTRDDVDSILSFAKLDKSDIKPTVQCLSFPPAMDSDTYKLMEIDSKLLARLEQNEQLVIRGHSADSAVMCSQSHTYDIRDAETSNSLLLIPDLHLPDQLAHINHNLITSSVCCLKRDYLEVKQIKPRLERLHTMLHEAPYSGPNQDEDITEGKYTMGELTDVVQASKEELSAALDAMNAICIDGYWRTLDTSYMDSVLTAIIAVRDENDWDVIPCRACCDQLSDIHPRFIVEHILSCFADKSSSEGESLYTLNEDKICRFLAEVILQATKKFDLAEFERTWQLSVPDGMQTSLSQLEGLALVDRDSHPAVIMYFPAAQLPQDVNERFMVLFKTKAKWSLEEITPYIEDLATEKVGVSSLLTKHARASTQGGCKVYSSKKPIT